MRSDARRATIWTTSSCSCGDQPPRSSSRPRRRAALSRSSAARPVTVSDEMPAVVRADRRDATASTATALDQVYEVRPAELVAEA